jgi:hypothetical protein
MSLEKVEGFSSLRKDTANGGVVNVDSQTYQNYKTQRILAKQKFEESKNTQQTVASLQTEINTIKSDMNDIKEILIKLLEKGK